MYGDFITTMIALNKMFINWIPTYSYSRMSHKDTKHSLHICLHIYHGDGTN